MTEKLLKKQGDGNGYGKFYMVDVIYKYVKYICHTVDVFLILKMP